MSERFTADLPFLVCRCSWSISRSDRLGLGELLLDRCAIEPDVLPANELVAKFEHVQDPECDRASKAGEPQHFSGDDPGHHLLEHECVLGGKRPDDDVLCGSEVRREMVI